MRSTTTAITIIIVLKCSAAFCQQKVQSAPVKDIAPLPSQRFPARWYPPDTVPTTEGIGPVVDAPYTAVSVETTKFQNPQSGKSEVRVSKVFTARDSKGRNRTEGPPSGGVDGVPMHEIMVQDSVSHCSFRWDVPALAFPDGPVAIVTCLPRTVNYVDFDVASVMELNTVRDVNTDATIEHGEPLGKRSFGEVEAIGVRNTISRKNPQAGQLAVTSTEVWYSPAIKEIVETRISPEVPGGAPDNRLMEIHLVEPDGSLFYPPANYRILTLHELDQAQSAPLPRPTVIPSP